MILTDVLNAWLQSLFGIDPLPTEEEHRLAKRIQEGDDDALDKLVIHNMRFVVHVLKKTPAWIHRTVPPEDLISIGNEQLIKAARRWIPTNNARFATFAKPFIIKGTRRELDNSANLIRLPVNIAEQIKRLTYNERALGQVLGRKPKASELATMLNVTEEKISELRAYMAREPVSLDSLNEERYLEEEGLE